jgi:peptidoglycan hydrolase-like protein with peptidoglycan-binding domain
MSILAKFLEAIRALFSKKAPAAALPPAPDPTPEPAPKRQDGREEEDVKVVQKQLVNLGHEFDGGADGLLGPQTRGAVEDFKEAHDITEEGIGPETLKAIDLEYKALAIPADLEIEVGDKGPKVKEFQQKLIALDHDMPRFGADGSFGDESLLATKEFQVENPALIGDEDAFKAQGVGPKTYKAVLDAVVKIKPPPPPVRPPPGPPLPAIPPPGMVVTKDLHPLKKGSGTRALKAIKGITFHQTATLLGEDPKRWWGVACHIAITRAGKIIYNNDFTKIVWHGNGFNSSTIGIEIDGHFAGIETFDPKSGKWIPDLATYWRPESAPDRMPLSATEAQIAAVKHVVRWIKRLVDGAGGKLEYLLAHRQSSPSRISDPGQKIWQLAVVPLLTELQMTDGGADYYILDSKGRPGKPLCEPWDPVRHPGVKYRITPKNFKGRPSKGP